MVYQRIVSNAIAELRLVPEGSRPLVSPVIARLTNFGSGSQSTAEVVRLLFSIYCALSPCRAATPSP